VIKGKQGHSQSLRVFIANQSCRGNTASTKTLENIDQTHTSLGKHKLLPQRVKLVKVQKDKPMERKSNKKQIRDDIHDFEIAYIQEKEKSVHIRKKSQMFGKTSTCESTYFCPSCRI